MGKGNASERLVSCGEDLEYAYTLSQIKELDTDIKNEWNEIWNKLTLKPAYNSNDPIRSSIQHSLHGIRHIVIIEYLEFFLKEYHRIINKVQ
ncbi:hypothetical protein JYT89_00735 [Flavobacteriaceae bacterium AH-315-B10]|nr:hypothetical protein [Flavobacteriaceae bacterium AH-315-B10]